MPPVPPHTTAPPERMSKVDTAWLRMDSAANRMMIVGVWVIRPGIRHQDLAQRLQQRLLKYPRFVQCAVEDATGANWVVDPDFDLARHLVVEPWPTRPRPTGRTAQTEQRALQERLAQLCMEPLDPAHPLWQFHLVEHYQGGSALMARIHHCIADGMALISVMHSLVDGGTPPPARARRLPRSALQGEAADGLTDTVLKPLAGMALKALAMADAHGGTDPARMAYHLMGDMAALALMSDDSATRLKGQPGPVKRVAWCAPLPLDEVKAIGKALGCSINDVLLSCVAGAIGQYLVSCGESVQGKEIRVMVPVNLRAPEQVHQLGNQFGLVPLLLPIGLDHPVERLLEVRKRMAGLKDSLQPLLAFGLLTVAGLLSKPAQDGLLNLFTRKATAVMTNVPGPREKLKICGATIEESLFWVPQSGTVGLGISVLSYGGGVQFGVVSDAVLCPDPQAIVDRFAPEFAKLTWLALMLPWGG